jgi:hypothetical protein
MPPEVVYLSGEVFELFFAPRPAHPETGCVVNHRD